MKKLILSILLSIITVNVNLSMETNSMDVDHQEQDCAKKSKKRKLAKIKNETEEFEEQSEINSSDDGNIYQKQLLKKIKIQVIELDPKSRQKLLAFLQKSCIDTDENSEMVSQNLTFPELPPEILLLIFDYCVALPLDFSSANLMDLIKSSCSNKAVILLLCKQFFAYKKNLDDRTRKYFTNVFRFVIQKEADGFNKLFVYHSERELTKLKIDNEIYEGDQIWERIKIGNSEGHDDYILALLKLGIDDSGMKILLLRKQSEGCYESNECFLADFILIRTHYNDEITEVYINQTADVNNRDLDGNTLLMRFIRDFDVSMMPTAFFNLIKGEIGRLVPYSIFIINLLIKKGADVNAVNKDGETALMSIIKHKNQCKYFPDWVKCLCSKRDIAKLDVNTQDKEGNTALMLLASLKDCSKFKILFEYIAVIGADFSLKNKRGKDVVEMGVNYYRKKTMKALIKKISGKNQLSDK